MTHFDSDIAAIRHARRNSGEQPPIRDMSCRGIGPLRIIGLGLL
jgi:hypothetical protein